MVICANLRLVCADSGEIFVPTRRKTSADAWQIAIGLPFAALWLRATTKGLFRLIGQASRSYYFYFGCQRAYGLAAAPEGWIILLLYKYLSGIVNIVNTNKICVFAIA